MNTSNDASATPRLWVEIWVFFGVLFILNTAFVVAIGEGWLERKYFAQGRLLLLAGTLIVIVCASRGVRAALGLFRPLFVWRVPPLVFLAAILWPFVFAISFVIIRSQVQGVPLQLTNPDGIALLQRDGVLFRVFVVSLVGEIVWVGYAIRNLNKFYALPIAAAITGTFWALWWLPMVIYGIGVIPGFTFFALWMNVLGVSFFCGFFYALTKSGLVILIMQFLFNCAVLSIPILPGVAGQGAFTASAATYMVLGFLAVVFLLPRIQGTQTTGLARP